MSSNIGELVQSCDIKLLSIEINDLTIEQNYINDLSIDWNGNFRIFGYCTINDHFDLVNTMLKTPGQQLTISYTDNYNVKFKRTFVVLQSSETKEQDFKTVTLSFQDIISFNLQKTFIAKSYAKTTLIDVFKDYVTLAVSDDIQNITIKEGTYDNIPFNNFVVPLNVDFLTFIKEEFHKAGIWLYQTKKNIIIGNDDVLETPEFDYTQVGDKDLYGFHIIEYDLSFNNIDKTNKVQKSDVMVFDKNTKSMKHYTKSFKDFMTEWNYGGYIQNSQLTNGTELKTKEYLIDTKKHDTKIYKYNTELHIIVPGNINYSLLYKKVNVKMSGASYTVKTRNEGDIKLSGKYIIYRVEDKFLVGHKFVQRLTLARAFEGKPL